MFNQEQKSYVSYTTAGIVFPRLLVNAVYIEKLHIGDGLLCMQNTRDGDGLLQAQNSAIGMGGDGRLHGHPKDISGSS